MSSSVGKRSEGVRQIAALPLRLGADGTVETLLVTSRRTRRWVLPKGNPMKGIADGEAAAIEAGEEAGIVGEVGRRPYASYSYWKRRSLSFELCRVDVFLLKVTSEKARWKEMAERQRNWVPLRLAARLVLEPGLQSILRSLAEDEDVASRLGADARRSPVPGKEWKFA